MLKDLDPLVSKLKEAHTILERTLAPLTDEQAIAITVTSEWSVKDAVAHLAGANRGMFGIAQRAARGEDPKLPAGYDNDTYNARQVAKRKEQTLAQIRAELDVTLNEMLAFLETVTQAQMDLQGEHPVFGEVKLKDLLVIIYSHETTHCNEIANAIHQAKK
ncbi:MAG: DinB family protein [Chloroflexi bacterium]|nr:DinB family protein [Chloroflexota bacterium]